MNGSFVLSLIAKRATVATKGAARRLVSPKCWNGGRGGSAASGVSATVQVHSPSLVTAFTLLCSVAERRSPLNHTLPLYTFYMFYTANLSAHSAPLRLCVKSPLPLYTFYMFYTANPVPHSPIHHFSNQSLQTLLFSNETHKNFRISLLITL